MSPRAKKPQLTTRFVDSYREVLREAGKISKDPRLLLWSLFMIFFPFYVFPSGAPQPADCVILILAPLVAFEAKNRLFSDGRRALRQLIVFIAYTIAVNVAWSVITFSFSFRFKNGFLMAPTFYLFDALLFVTFLRLYQRYGERFLWITTRLALVSVGGQVLLSAVMRAHVGRSTLLFNNPNQLGYYALLTACLTLMGHKRLRMSTLMTTAGLIACSYLALMSASKAALASIGLLGMVLMITRLRTMLMAAAVLLALIFTSNPFSRAIDHAHDRIENDKSFGFVEERGYDRIFQHQEYWVLGSGEGGYRRWRETSAIGGHELHSSLGTLFFCYGAIGTLLFVLFMWKVLWGNALRTWLVVGAPLAYGMTHQGLRFMLFWVLIAAAVGVRNAERVPRPKKMAKPRLVPEAA